jgi:ATP-binding cassette subfamily C (CFTR/MRP) protein 4
MAAATLRAPLAFFHTTPAGRILNRFTKDQGIADDYLPMVAFDALQSCALVVGSLTMMAVAVPAVLPVFLPLAAAFHYFRSRYLAATRAVKRFDGTTRSPVFAALGEAPRGLATVRAYGVAPRFAADFAGLAGRNLSWWAAFVACARHLGVRLDAVATAALAAEAALLTGLAARVDPRLAGLALTNCIGLAGALQWAVRQVAEWEVSMTSVERQLELTRLDAEPPTLALGGPPPPPGWPPHGGVEFDGVSAVYRPGLPAVLVDLTLTVPPGSR